MMNAIYTFLLGERIYKALLDELNKGDRLTAFFVLFCVTSTPLLGLVELLKWLVK